MSLSSLDQNQETSVILTPSILFESTNDDSEDDDNESRDFDESSTVSTLSTRMNQESDDYKDSYDSDDYGYDDYDSSDDYNDYDNGYGRPDYSHGFGRPRYYERYNGHPRNVFSYPNYYRGGYYNRF
ncbi:hypothetical protein Poli38472_007679 [Pythium oligandrum]|uniref:Uncharacterized protein n=1 Tax=Pythium oligandrum TaxID=41045 RepID=A0A8K1CSM1_PYTOL|nr:hypothetical protein Poli38472_007679 [Pythium oligandrum]|eukprot:TMW68007.1 hypothetical protein Poli38472_007679 [Pythium oligandrum]